MLTLASLPRFPPGAGLMERIQAIAQNVSDIAVKVDQILRHSLLLHGKGGAQGTPCPQEASVPALTAPHGTSPGSGLRL